MSVLIDTNILLRSAQPLHPMYDHAVQAAKSLADSGEKLFVAIQNVAEFLNVATRQTAQNGLGFTIEKAHAEVDKLESTLEVISETIDSYRLWKTLVADYGVSGVQVHDARLVSIMQANGISRILTFNTKDFTRFDGIEAVHPGEVG